MLKLSCNKHRDSAIADLNVKESWYLGNLGHSNIFTQMMSGLVNGINSNVCPIVSGLNVDKAKCGKGRTRVVLPAEKVQYCRSSFLLNFSFLVYFTEIKKRPADFVLER